MTFVTTSHANRHDKKSIPKSVCLSFHLGLLPSFILQCKSLIHNVLSLYPFQKNGLSTVVLIGMRPTGLLPSFILQCKSLIRSYTAFLASFAKNISFRVGFNTIKFTKNKPTNQANATPIVSKLNSKLSLVKKST